MKIKVKDLEPNPFRDFDSYPIDKERLRGLKDSMQKDEFWGGIPVRPHPTKKGKYQIACAHHRLLSLKQNKIEEVDISAIYSYSDAQMLRIMINENAEYADRPKIINADVEKAKKFLDNEFFKYDTMSDLLSHLKSISDGMREEDFKRLKKKGVGRGIILAYLGKSWIGKAWRIQEALDVIRQTKQGKIDRQAVEQFEATHTGKVFRESVVREKVPVKKQQHLAENIIKQEIEVKRIPDYVEEKYGFAIKSKKETPKPKELPMLDDVIKETCSLMNTLYAKLTQIKNHLDNVESKRLKATFMRDGQELTELMEGIFKNEKSETKKKRVLSNSG